MLKISQYPPSLSLSLSLSLTHTHTHMHARMYSRTHAHTHTHTRTHTHTHAHARTHARTYARTDRRTDRERINKPQLLMRTTSRQSGFEPAGPGTVCAYPPVDLGFWLSWLTAYMYIIHIQNKGSRSSSPRRFFQS